SLQTAHIGQLNTLKTLRQPQPFGRVSVGLRVYSAPYEESLAVAEDVVDFYCARFLAQPNRGGARGRFAFLAAKSESRGRGDHGMGPAQAPGKPGRGHGLPDLSRTRLH